MDGGGRNVELNMSFSDLPVEASHVPSEKFELENSEKETLIEKETMGSKNERFLREKSFKEAKANPYGGLFKLERLLREKALKKPMSKSMDESKKEDFKGEKLMASAIKAEGTSREESKRLNKKKKYKYETKSDEIGESSKSREFENYSMEFESNSMEFESKPIREKRGFQSRRRMNRLYRYNRRYIEETESDSDEEPDWNSMKRTKKDQTSDLPEIFKETIEFIKGTSTKLVMQKRLSHRDHCTLNYYNSFLIEFEESFLTEEEEELLNNGEEIMTVFIEPIISVSRNTLSKHEGTNYGLSMHWNKVAIENELRVGTVVQLWSFRIQEMLGFVLVKVVKEVKDGDGLDGYDEYWRRRMRSQS